MSTDSAAAFSQFHQRRSPIRARGVVKDKVASNLTDKRFEVIVRGETPAGDPVALVKVEDGLATPVVVLVVNNEVNQIWDADAQEDATAMFQKVVVLGTGGGK
jgi:hypothetical protein